MSRKRADLIFSLVLLIVLAWMVWEARNWDLRARLFPVAVGIPAIGLALFQVGAVLKRSVTWHKPAAVPEPGEASVPPEVARVRSLHMLLWVVASACSVVLLGFELGGALLTFLFLRFASHERLRTSLVISLVAYLVFYGLFERVLLIPLPPGAVADALDLDKPLDRYLLAAAASLFGRG